MEELIGLLIGGIIGWLTKENAELRNNANNQAKSSHHNQSNYTETQSNFRGGGNFTSNTKKINQNQQSQRLSIQNLSCAIDMVCYFSLKYEPNWHSEKIKFVRSRFQQFCLDDNDLLFLRNRVKSSTHNLPNIANSISDFVHKFNDEELTAYIFDTIVRLLVVTNSENLASIEREAIDFSRKIQLPQYIAKQILNDVFADLHREDFRHENHFAHQNNSVDLEAQAYELLGIPPNATIAEIKAAYRKKMMEFHPDRNPQITETVRKMLNEESHKVKQAYEYLMKLKGGK